MFNFNNAYEYPRTISIANFAKQHGVGKNRLLSFLREKELLERDYNNEHFAGPKALNGWFISRHSIRTKEYNEPIAVTDLTQEGATELEAIIKEYGIDKINSIKTR